MEPSLLSTLAFYIAVACLFLLLAVAWSVPKQRVGWTGPDLPAEKGGSVPTPRPGTRPYRGLFTVPVLWGPGTGNPVWSAALVAAMGTRAVVGGSGLQDGPTSGRTAQPELQVPEDARGTAPSPPWG